MKRTNGVVAALVAAAGGMLVGGCSAQSGGARSQIVANGVPPISYLVSGPGTVYVVDKTKDAVVHSGTYADLDDPFLVDVGEKVQLRNVRTRETVTLVGGVNEKDWYEIWFCPAEKGKHGAATTRKEKAE